MPYPVRSNNESAYKCNHINISLRNTSFVLASVLVILCGLNAATDGVGAVAVASSGGDVVHLLDDIDQENEGPKRAVVTPLGKRLTSNLVSKLGNRPKHLYSFGIGKY